jgi:hypothetical protein
MAAAQSARHVLKTTFVLLLVQSARAWGMGSSFGSASVARVPSRVVPWPVSPQQVTCMTPRKFIAFYDRASSECHYQTSATQSGLLGAGSDALSQTMHGLPLDMPHLLAMAVLAAILSGAGNACWLRHLERTVPGSSARAVLTKTLADFCIAGTLANSALLICIPALTLLFAGASSGEVWTLDGWTINGFRTVMLVELCTFAPYNLCAFRLVPPRLRPLSAATVSATCAVALSGVTLGYV